MDVLRRELNSIYAAQNLGAERLDASVLTDSLTRLRHIVAVEDDCRVITDAASDRCYICCGALGALLGLQTAPEVTSTEFGSSDEDEIYSRMHPEDLVDKRMLEYEFFKFVDHLDRDIKPHFRATCRIRLQAQRGQYIYIDNTTRILHPSPAGRIWLILCTYTLSPSQERADGISPRIVNNMTGEVIGLSLGDRRGRILTEREKEILRKIRDGLPSKLIADILGISINTVNRHRQNILEKLSVGNSVEAVRAASEMNLL